MTCPQDCGACPSNCSHNECATGAALVSGCSVCATQVCNNDAYCCTTSWDSLCVSEVASYCGFSCPPPACAHSECVTGVALTSGCSACVTQVCANDSYCCSFDWDIFCVDEVDLYCTFSCP